MNTKKISGKQKQAIALVKNLLLGRRNNNVRQEQIAYDKLVKWCEKNNLDMENVITGATRALQGSISASMGGLI